MTRAGRATILHAAAAALIAASAEQIVHEVCHGVVATLVGKRWTFFNLFAAGSVWPAAAGELGDTLVAGSSAVLNIACGSAGVWLLARWPAAAAPLARLLVTLFAAYSLFAGFGYLMVDAIFYRPGGANLGDWRRVIDALGGGLGVRAAIGGVGLAGTLWGYLWFPRAVLQIGAPREPADRPRVAFALAMVPYLVVNTWFTLLAIWHPLGLAGLVLMAMKYWLGYCGLFWGHFIAGHWSRYQPPLAGAPLPERVSRPLLVAAAAVLVLDVLLVLPRLE